MTIQNTQQEVKKLKTNISQHQPVLEQQKEDNLKLLQELAETTKQSEITQELIAKEQEAAQIKRDEVNDIKVSC